MRKIVSSADRGFIAKTLSAFASLFENELYNDRFASLDRLLQNIDPRVKILTALAFIIFANMTKSTAILTALGIVGIIYAAFSGLIISDFIRRTWLYIPVLLFIISLPGVSSLFIKGDALIGTGAFYFTARGLASAAGIALRAGDSLTYTFLLLMTTKWADLMSGLRAMKVPEIFVSVLNMAYRYLFLLAETGTDMMHARHLRTIGRISSSGSRRFVGGSFGHLFVKIHGMSENVYGAMTLRGFHGTPRTMNTLKIGTFDLLFSAINIIILFILIVGGYIFG